jgi:hypothetical protein
VTITSDNSDLGEELEVEYNADPTAIGFNPKYVWAGIGIVKNWIHLSLIRRCCREMIAFRLNVTW